MPPIDLEHDDAQLKSCWNSLGLYHREQFTLTLRRDMFEKIYSSPQGIVGPSDISADQLEAQSIYIHESIHWWQHVGSTSGLFLSLVNPSRAHFCHDSLLKSIELLGPVKSIADLRFNDEKYSMLNEQQKSCINNILNYWLDYEYCKLILSNSDEFHDSDMFEGRNHVYAISLGSILIMIETSMSSNQLFADGKKVLDHIFRAAGGSCELKNEKKHLSQLGARHLFEGQARFNQLQFLELTLKQSRTFEQLDELGYFSDDYKRAFDIFIDLTGFEIPNTVLHEVVSLFLLVVDISINSYEGLLYEIKDLDGIDKAIDPGFRFTEICTHIGDSNEKYKDRIVEHSSEECRRITDDICTSLGYKTIDDYSKKFEKLKSNSALSGILDQDLSFAFAPGNTCLKVLLSRFLSFQADKSKYLSYFIWPGMANGSVSNSEFGGEKNFSLFKEHSALFIHDIDDNVYPTLIPNRPEENVKSTFLSFYVDVFMYDLIHQWVFKSGDFDTSFHWNSLNYSAEEYRSHLNRHFSSIFGVTMDDFTVLVE